MILYTIPVEKTFTRANMDEDQIHRPSYTPITMFLLMPMNQSSILPIDFQISVPFSAFDQHTISFYACVRPLARVCAELKSFLYFASCLSGYYR